MTGASPAREHPRLAGALQDAIAGWDRIGAQTRFYVKTLAAIPEVIEAYLVSGEYDYLLRVAVKDTRDYERLLREKLYRIPGIRHSKSSFVLRKLKESDIPLTSGTLPAPVTGAGTPPEPATAGAGKPAGARKSNRP